MTELATALATAQALADLAGPTARAAWAAGDAGLQAKPDGSAVTPADRGIEARLRDEIARRHPGHGILGEEFGPDRTGAAHVWVIDPIDGTRQFAAGLGNWAVLVALCRDGVPVLGVIDLPLAGARHWAVTGGGSWFATAGGPARRVACRGTADPARAVVALANPDSLTPPARAALADLGALRVHDGGSPAYGALARGRVDLVVNGGDLDAFDICALVPVVAEAGGRICGWDGAAPGLDSRGAILAAATPALMAAARTRLAGVRQMAARLDSPGAG